MLKFKRIDGDKLSDQFGMDTDTFEDAAKLWGKVQGMINEGMEKAMKPKEGGVEYDARESMELFFKYFNTQELQDIALVQFLMKDLSDRGEHTAMKLAKEQVLEMMKGMGKDSDDVSKDVDLEDLL